MVRRGSEAAGQVWRLAGVWRVWLWSSAAIFVLFLVAGLGFVVVAVVAAVGTPSGLVLLLPAAILLAVASIMGWQLWHIATTVSVGVDGTVVIRRPLGELRTRAHAVRQVRPSAFVSGRNTPTVVETPDGWAHLVRARTEKEAVVAAILAFNPSLRIEI